MKVKMVLEYEITGNIPLGLKALSEQYSYYQGRTESISSVDFKVRCIQPIPTLQPEEK